MHKWAGGAADGAHTQNWQGARLIRWRPAGNGHRASLIQLISKAEKMLEVAARVVEVSGRAADFMGFARPPNALQGQRRQDLVTSMPATAAMTRASTGIRPGSASSHHRDDARSERD